MDRLSAVIITKNEEDKIGKCLNSLRYFVDEIIVVDDCSSDNTVDICREYGAKVIIHQLENSFDKQRNLGIKDASGDWILQMDADEIVPKETAEAIKSTISNSKDYVAFRLRRKNFFLGYPLRYAGTYEYADKLFKKGAAIYEGRVHERLKMEGRIGVIEKDIYHYPFNLIKEVIRRANFYTDIETDEFIKTGNEISFKEIKYRLTWKSLKLFWKLYVRKRGYKDGMHGLVWCVLNVIGPQIKWLKVWEKAVKEDRLDK